MDLRIALVGSDPLRLKALEAELRLEGIPVVTATTAETLAPQVRTVHPTVTVALAELSVPAEAQRVAQLLVHPATAAIPIVVVSPQLEARAAVRALRSGVIDVLVGAPQGKLLVETLIRLLGSEREDPRRRAAMDRRGPTVLRRIGDFLRTHKGDGVLAIRGDRLEGKIRFAGGQIRSAETGGSEGGEAIRKLLADPTQAPWDFLLVTEAEMAAAEDVLELEEVDVEVDIVDADDLPSSPGMPAVTEGDERPLRILLVDDDPDLLTMYGAFMRRRGWQVETAENGRRGYDLAIHNRPDVIVSDIMMPETDGWGFLTSVRGDYRLRETPFLLLSCHGEYLHNLEHLDAGANDYLEKGLRADEVLDRIQASASPRARFQTACDPGVAMSGKVEETGTALLLRELGQRRATGTLHLQSGWIEAGLKLSEGRIVAARAEMGEHVDEGEEAIRRVLVLDGGAYTWLPGAVEPGSFAVFFPEVADTLAIQLNREREDAQEHILRGESPLRLDPDKVAFYERVCADAIHPIIELLREGAPPRAAMQDSEASPLLVEWVVKDLLRKGIARF